MFALIKANMDLCQIAKEEGSLISAEATEFLKQAARQIRNVKSEPWDIVFFDPPYAHDHLQVMELFVNPGSNLLAESGLLIVEHHHKNLLPDELGTLRRSRLLKQGDSALSFYETSKVAASRNHC